MGMRYPSLRDRMGIQSNKARPGLAQSLARGKCPVMPGAIHAVGGGGIIMKGYSSPGAQLPGADPVVPRGLRKLLFRPFHRAPDRLSAVAPGKQERSQALGSWPAKSHLLPRTSTGTSSNQSPALSVMAASKLIYLTAPCFLSRQPSCFVADTEL